MLPLQKFTELIFQLIKLILSKFNINTTAPSERLTIPNLSIMQNISLAFSAVTIWFYIVLDTLYCVVTESLGLTFEDLSKFEDDYDEC
ncbi:MAG: hypothetical protein ACTS4Z_00465 [Candidatus Hodgkinia cicadicola]